MSRERATPPSALKAGTLLRYAGFEQTPSVEIRHVMLPGHPEYDGALPGISYRWLKRPGVKRWFFPCGSVKEFFSHELFANLEIANGK